MSEPSKTNTHIFGAWADASDADYITTLNSMMAARRMRNYITHNGITSDATILTSNGIVAVEMKEVTDVNEASHAPVSDERPPRWSGTVTFDEAEEKLVRTAALRSKTIHTYTAKRSVLPSTERFFGGGEGSAKVKGRVQRVQVPPGSLMLTVAETVFSPKTKERVFDQIVADFREEYFAAVQEGARAKIFFVITRHWTGFVFAFILEMAYAIGRIIKAVRGVG